MLKPGRNTNVPLETGTAGGFREVSNDPEIRGWLSSQGLENLVAETNNGGSTNYPTATPVTVDVTENTDIRQWLQEQGLSHLVVNQETEHQQQQQYQIPSQFPDLFADDFKVDNGNGGRNRSLSAGIIFPSDFYGTNGDTGEVGYAAGSSKHLRPTSNGIEMFNNHQLPSPYFHEMKTKTSTRHHHKKRSSSSSYSSSSSRTKSSSSSSPSSNSRSDNHIIHIGPDGVHSTGKGRKHRLHVRSDNDSGDALVQKQRVFVRYLQPPTPKPGGPIIIKEKRDKEKKPASPIIIRQRYPSPPTPLPIIYREQPPRQPSPGPVTIIEKRVQNPTPPRPIIIEKMAPPPSKHPDIIIEKWLPPKPRQRREIIIQKCEPVHREPQRITIVEQRQPSFKYIKHICPEGRTRKSRCKSRH